MKYFFLLIKKKIENLLAKIDLFIVLTYKHHVFYKIFFIKKLNSLKKINIRKKIFRIGYAFGKKTKCSFIKNFFKNQYCKLNSLGSNILAKYVAKELLLYFTVCFAFFFVIFFVNQILLLAETILKKRVPLISVIKLIIYCLPAIIAQAAPFSTLVGFLMCLGRLVTDNEVLIFRASGQKYSLILKSVFVMGLLISIFSFIMNDYFLPLGNLNYTKMRRKIITSNPAIELESMSIKRMNDSIFVIGNVNGTKVSDLVFFDTGRDGNSRIIFAKDSEIKKSTSEGVLMHLDMNNPVVLMMKNIQSGSYDSLLSEKLSLSIFEESIIYSNGGVSPREMTSWDLGKKIKLLKKDKKLSSKIYNTYKLEFNKKFSLPFGSIFFAILAFPLSLIFGKKDGQTLGLIFGIILSVLYWAATIIGQMFGVRGGYNGFWMMWTPNFILGLFGIILYLRLKKK